MHIWAQISLDSFFFLQLTVTVNHAPNEANTYLDDDSHEDATSSSSSSSSPNFDVNVLFGKRDNELDLIFARQIGEVLLATTPSNYHPDTSAPSPDQKPRPLLLALSLKDPNLEDLVQISQEISLALKQ